MFREDDSRTRERMLGNNLSRLQRFAITRLKLHPLKESVRGKMQIAGWNDDFLAEVLIRIPINNWAATRAKTSEVFEISEVC